MRVDIRKGTALEMNRLYHAAEFDCIIACLVLSEMTPDEQAWVLHECRRILKPGGKLLLADEFLPQNPLRRFLARCLSWPLHMVTYLWLHFRSLYAANLWQTLYYCVVEMPLLLLSALVSFPFNHPLREQPVGLPAGMGVLEVRKFRGGLRLLEITRLAEGLCAN
jgi:SAM-dependent methyltransferase